MCWVPVLSIDFFKVMFSIREYLCMPPCTCFTDKDTMFHFKVSRLVTHAINAVGVELIVSNSFFEKSFQITVLFLRNILLYLGRFYGLLVNLLYWLLRWLLRSSLWHWALCLLHRLLHRLLLHGLLHGLLLHWLLLHWLLHWLLHRLLHRLLHWLLHRLLLLHR